MPYRFAIGAKIGSFHIVTTLVVTPSHARVARLGQRGLAVGTETTVSTKLLCKS